MNIMPILPLLLLFVVLPAQAAVQNLAPLQIRTDIPAGWRVQQHGQDELVVRPERKEERERGGVRVQLTPVVLRSAASLERIAANYRRASGSREVADKVEIKRGKLLVLYRESEYVQSGLWIVRQKLVVWQQQDGKRYIRARCEANASEYAQYRERFDRLCNGMQRLEGEK